jgi:HSP20 family protein
MAIVRWSPFGELERVRREMDRLFDQATSGTRGDESLGGGWYPAVDVYEDHEQVVLAMELPGLDRKDVSVNIENNVLTISGERQLENEEKRENYSRIERFYGRFSRSFTLPNTVDPDACQATMERGILTVRFPRREEARPRQIEVKVR